MAVMIAEIRSWETEGKRQKTGVRSQKSGVGSQRELGVRSQKSFLLRRNKFSICRNDQKPIM
jgi:hypothetical protein